MGSDLNVGHTVAMSEQIEDVGSGGQGGRQGRDSCVASSQTSFSGITSLSNKWQMPPIYWVLCALSMQHLHCFCLVYLSDGLLQNYLKFWDRFDPAFALKAPQLLPSLLPKSRWTHRPPSVMASLTECQKACLHFFCFFFSGQV